MGIPSRRSITQQPYVEAARHNAAFGAVQSSRLGALRDQEGALRRWTRAASDVVANRGRDPGCRDVPTPP